MQQLDAELAFKNWYDGCAATMDSFEGSAKLDFPDDMRKRLSLQIALFRRIAKGEIDVTDVCSMFILRAGDWDVKSNAVCTQIFTPMAKDLRRYLIRAARQQEMSILSQIDVPASDRVVRLDHNSAAYSEAVEALKNVEEAVEGANEYPDQEDKQQRIAELSAGRKLLEAVRVRITPLKVLLGETLMWLTKQFATGIIGALARQAWTAVLGLF